MTTVKELIEKLKEYPEDMQVATDYDWGFDIEVTVRHADSENPKVEEFDYVSIS